MGILINTDVVERLGTDIHRLRRKYDPKKITDLEKIAKKEYGVINVIETPLVYDANVLVEDASGGLHIFYYASFKPNKKYLLGHEIGHIAAGHPNQSVPTTLHGREEQEAEADYFSMKLHGVSSKKYKIYDKVNRLFSVKEDFVSRFRGWGEVERLMEMGVYHLIADPAKAFSRGF